MPDPAVSEKDFSAYTRKVLTTLGLVVLVFLLWRMRDALLLAFFGLLLAVLLRGLAGPLSRHTRLPAKGAVGVVAVLLAAAIAGVAMWLGPQLSAQFNQFAAALPETIASVEQTLRKQAWGQYVLDRMQGSSEGGGAQLFGQVTSVVTQAFGAVLDLFIVVAVGLYFAVDPKLYERGLTMLVPPAHREQVHETLEASGTALWHWLKGRLAAMLAIGVIMMVGLTLLGVPLALVLGLIAALLDFVPFIGPILAALPGLLIALTMGPTTALYVGLLYLGVQQLEGNLITPLVQRRQVMLPPVLTIIAVVAFGLLFGVRGLLVATPLTVVTLVFVKKLYLEDTLGDHVAVPGRDEA